MVLRLTILSPLAPLATMLALLLVAPAASVAVRSFSTRSVTEGKFPIRNLHNSSIYPSPFSHPRHGSTTHLDPTASKPKSNIISPSPFLSLPSHSITVAHHMKCTTASDCTLPGARCVDVLTLAEGRTETDAVCTDPNSTNGCMCYGPANACDNPSQCGTGTRCALVLPDMATYCLPCELACTPAYTSRRLSLTDSDSVRAIAAICIDADPETCDTSATSSHSVSTVDPSLESSPEPRMTDPFFPRGPDVSVSPVVSDPFPFPEPSMISPAVSDPYPDPYSSPTKTPCTSHSPGTTLYLVPLFSPDDDEEDPFSSSSPSPSASSSYYDPYEPSSSPEMFVDPFPSPSKSPCNTGHIESSMSPGMSDHYYPTATYVEPSPMMTDPYTTVIVTPYMSQMPYPEPSESDEPEYSDPFASPLGSPSKSSHVDPRNIDGKTPDPSSLATYYPSYAMGTPVPVGSYDPYLTLMPSEPYYPNVSPTGTYDPHATPLESYYPEASPMESNVPFGTTPRALPSNDPTIPDMATPSYSSDMTPTFTPLQSDAFSSSSSPLPLVTTDTPYPTYSTYPYDGTPGPDESTDPSPSDEAADVCIGVDALRHLDMDELVFPQHFRATVLCDAKRNCATPGHIVVHDGVPMMMKTYCEGLRVKKGDEEMCTRKVMFVNSPRMKYGQRIKSNSDGLEFTALAARFESKLEEHVMALVARVYA